MSNFGVVLLFWFSVLLLLLVESGKAQRWQQQQQRTRERHLEKHSEVRAAKGQFMVHMLHSAYFFPQTVEVKWSASLRGKPELPQWLHLAKSRHKAIAYLVGSPITPLDQVTIHVIARRLDNFQSSDHFITIVLTEDVRFNSITQQIVEFRLTNIGAEELFSGRDGKLKNLEKAIHSTFRGKSVNPYIFNIVPEMDQPPEDFNYRTSRHRINMGSIVQVGTQSHFHSNVQQIARGLQLNPQYCAKNKFVPMDKNFRPMFRVDWCHFFLRNLSSMTNKASESAIEPETPGHLNIGGKTNGSTLANHARGRQIYEEMDAQTRKYPPPVYYIWESVLVFPLLAVFCLLCILLLSFIFFGRREGQQWRDYKTPKEQLQEYLNVRDSQRHLRELSVQRQMQFMSNSEQGASDAPMGIQTFLQPRSPQTSERTTNLIDGGSQQRLLPSPGGQSQWPQGSIASLNRSSIGKQTVAEAARATGSSLRLYRNPLDDDSEDEEHHQGHKNGSNQYKNNPNNNNNQYSSYNGGMKREPTANGWPSRRQQPGTWGYGSQTKI